MQKKKQLTARQAATRIAMYFERAIPTARPDFPERQDLVSVRVSMKDFRALVSKLAYKDKFHDELCDELFEYSLLLARCPDYMLLTGWQDPAHVPLPSNSAALHEVIELASRWDDQSYAEEYEKNWPWDS